MTYLSHKKLKKITHVNKCVHPRKIHLRYEIQEINFSKTGLGVIDDCCLLVCVKFVAELMISFISICFTLLFSRVGYRVFKESGD